MTSPSTAGSASTSTSGSPSAGAPRDLAARALVTKCVADVAADAIRARRTELADALTNGDRIQVSAPDDPELDLGMVLRTKPKGSASITDQAAFTAWMAAAYPDRVERAATVVDPAAAIEVLSEHAPHLVALTAVVAPWAESEVLTCTTRAKEPCGPGGELDVPGVTYEPPRPGVVTVKLSEDGPAVIEQLWREGRIDLTSGEVRALPEGRERKAMGG